MHLDKLWTAAEKTLTEKHLILVCNAKEAPNLSERCGSFQMDTEYFSDDEFEQIVSMFRSVGLPTDFFTYEDDFFRYVVEDAPTDLLVYNAAQSGTGPGRKSLIPAFCNLHGIPCTGSNAYVVSLCRHKYHVNRLLSQEGIKVPETWLYFNGWLMGRQPPLNEKVILKPIYESASIGIDDGSIWPYTPAVDAIAAQRATQLCQPIIAQKFISGYEVEIPMVCVGNQVFQLPAVGLSIDERRYLGGNILDYDRIYFDRYGFYDFSTESKEISESLCSCAADVAHILGMDGLCRVDFRVELGGSFSVTDVSTNPHFVAHSSVNYAFAQIGMSSDHIAKTILSAALAKESR